MRDATTASPSRQTQPKSTNLDPGTTAEETRDLLELYARTKDEKVREQLIHQHDRLVGYVASRIGATGGATLEDLIQVGYLGLIAAIERFDPNKGGNFVTFAVPTIMGFIKHYLRDQTWGVKVPRRLRELGISLRRTRAQLMQKLGRVPTPAEMAEAAGISQERLLEAMELERVYQPASLDASRNAEDGAERPMFFDLFGSEDSGFEAIEDRETLRRAMENLDERQQAILYHRYYDDASQAEVARRLGISQMHVSRLERRALVRLKEILA